jgi:hypothetical protein
LYKINSKKASKGKDVNVVRNIGASGIEIEGED